MILSKLTPEEQRLYRSHYIEKRPFVTLSQEWKGFPRPSLRMRAVRLAQKKSKNGQNTFPLRENPPQKSHSFYLKRRSGWWKERLLKTNWSKLAKKWWLSKKIKRTAKPTGWCCTGYLISGRPSSRRKLHFLSASPYTKPSSPVQKEESWLKRKISIPIQLAAVICILW